MSAPASKRQKIAADDAADIASDRGDRGGKPTSPWAELAVTAWGHAVDYLRYSEVRQTLMVSKTVGSEVPKHVQTMNVLSATEMNVRTARRFPNCAEVNILCFIVQDEEDPDYSVLVEDAVHRVVPFLTFFPKLKDVFVGGVLRSLDNDSTTLE